MTWQAIIFYLLALDALTYNFLAWVGEGWYVHNFRTFSRNMPATKSLALYYLAVVIYIGWLTRSMGLLPF